MEKPESCGPPTLPCAPFTMSYERGDFTFPRPPAVLPTRGLCLPPLGNSKAGLAAAGMEGQGLVARKEACTWVGRAKGPGGSCAPPELMAAERPERGGAGPSASWLSPHPVCRELSSGQVHTEECLSTSREPEPAG